MSRRFASTQIAPAGAKAFGAVFGYVMQSGLPAALVDLVYLRVSQINNCAYCTDMHTRELLKKGQKVEKLALVQDWAEAGNLFDERERAALAWAETVTRVAKTGVPDEECREAARAVFEERELVDLTLAIGLMNAHTRSDQVEAWAAWMLQEALPGRHWGYPPREIRDDRAKGSRPAGCRAYADDAINCLCIDLARTAEGREA
jgi:AhpD family alkylhydroperoxidase